MRVSVFGLGYVGSVTAACLAKAGHDVVGVDVNPDKVGLVDRGLSPIVEGGLDVLVAETVAAGRLRATADGGAAVTGTDLSLLCVGTPSRSNGQLDVSALERVVAAIGRALRARPKRHTVVVRSTVLPGTTEGVLAPILRAGAGPAAASALRLAVSPEFMREGSSLRDFAEPPFTLVGCDDEETAALLRGLYHGVDAPFIHTSVSTAEMVKYVSNAFHALKVCFANEIGTLADVLGADVQEVMRIFRLDRKLNISDAYLRPGFAYGGSCLPKDLRALVHAARSRDLTLPLLSAIAPSNERQIRQALETILATHRRRIGMVGLSFKPGTDDLRESPLVLLVEALIGKGCDVRILDRDVSVARLVGANRRYIEEEIPHIASLLCDTAEALVAHADVLVIGNSDTDASAALALVGPEHLVIDLTRGAGRPRGGSPASP